MWTREPSNRLLPCSMRRAHPRRLFRRTCTAWFPQRCQHQANTRFSSLGKAGLGRPRRPEPSCRSLPCAARVTFVTGCWTALRCSKPSATHRRVRTRTLRGSGNLSRCTSQGPKSSVQRSDLSCWRLRAWLETFHQESAHTTCSTTFELRWKRWVVENHCVASRTILSGSIWRDSRAQLLASVSAWQWDHLKQSHFVALRTLLKAFWALAHGHRTS
mmetsp:Transcript_55372/g.147830  ORF Transcript_55372/g.147830 Transcript_55372/m.147830 type:complete len:216 (-) Transcript_55372:3027-3674(-)